ncbi:FtsK/SpoIIIE domain-containing protein [Okibacterium fritillariae]|uniref:FtsK/SpoIIIE domain-containing protein n=1 Tax=Okibacterium fritillariae TaxID=123320 RepID=UPI0040553714
MNDLLDNLIPLAITAFVLIGGGALAVRVFLPRLILANAKRKRPLNERETFDYLQKILTIEEVVETYAPSKPFMKEIEKEQKAHPQAAWLSPFPQAVKKANARNKPAKTAQRFLLARAQIAHAAKSVSVAELPEDLQPGNAGPEHFFINLQLDGKPEGKIKALEAVIKSTLGLHSLTPTDADDFFSIRYIGHAVSPVDKIEGLTPGADFFEQYPAARITSIPLAVKANGEAWELPTHHTLIHGTTGSGKGSPIQGMIRQLEPFIHEEIVKLYGIDPKSGEIKPFVGSSLFAGIAIGDNESMVGMINALHALMKARQDSIVATKANDFGRTVPFDKETPLVIIFIDEFLSLLSAMKNMGKPGAVAVQRLTEILAQGRSGNIFVVAATQAATKDLMGDMRENFPNKIVLRLEDGQTYWNDLWLGDTASAQGFDATKIRKSGASNNYATAGVGYVKELSGSPVKVRFARTTADDLEDLLNRNRKATSTPEPPSGLALSTVHADDDANDADDLVDDGAFGFEEIPGTDNDDDELGMPDLSELSLPDLNTNH